MPRPILVPQPTPAGSTPHRAPGRALAVAALPGWSACDQHAGGAAPSGFTGIDIDLTGADLTGADHTRDFVLTDVKSFPHTLVCLFKPQGRERVVLEHEQTATDVQRTLAESAA